ncbi:MULTISPECIES: hypothetical protein [Enterococcus]|uniref:hypothetical protein n=1 Tax=Enterococcus TaxID=1350 RepID=UPI000A38DAA9|nr:hypothetical protein [Enterococcus sp. 4E1_DIV0656]OTO09196.1 hypothetical protein A5882_003526 [Enterococcus sp. 4E1_DIV0656]
MSLNRCWVLDNKGVFEDTEEGRAASLNLFRESLNLMYPGYEVRITSELNETGKVRAYHGEILNEFDEVWYRKSSLTLLNNLQNAISEVEKYVVN